MKEITITLTEREVDAVKLALACLPNEFPAGSSYEAEAVALSRKMLGTFAITATLRVRDGGDDE